MDNIFVIMIYCKPTYKFKSKQGNYVLCQTDVKQMCCCIYNIKVFLFILTSALMTGKNMNVDPDEYS